ncbi:hydroxypyruvate isomerase family protein [Micromonospora sp. NPDC050417]|uniref:hydroxypyruvate isomerase family protein n=1 Tax=Micromonospora sp. NPDC050417 TaxID=3364280 RepID=UPI003794681C
MTAHDLRFDVNLSILFTELPLLHRPAAAAEAGFDAVEFWWPFAEPVPADRDVTAFLTALDNAGVRLVGLNFAAGDMAAGDRGLLSQPANSARFRDNIDVAIGIAEATGCRALNALYGNRVDGVDPAAQDDLAAENLALAAEAAGGAGAIVLLEPLNSEQNPAYPLATAADVRAVIDRVRVGSGQHNVRLLCDLYHLASNGEDLEKVITTHTGHIGHVQIADAPGRHQPGTGGLDLDGLLAQLERAGYRGYVGCEYKPLGASADSFGWLPRERRASARL